jgi:tetratricopeptide (TPR) repeat protein
MAQKKKYIVPRRHRPEMYTIAGRILIRKYVRFMRRYTDMPVGLAVPVNEQLVADILLMRDLYRFEPRGRCWSVAAQREEILGLLPDSDIDSASCKKIAREIAKEGPVQVLSDELVDSVINRYDDLLCSLFVENVGNIEDPQNANEYHCRAHALHAQGDEAAALAAYDRAIEAEPDCITYRTSRALLLENLGRAAEAAADWLAACKAASEEEDPVEYFETLQGLCLIWLKLESIPDFVAAFEELVRIVARITFETVWDSDGEGVFDNNLHFPGSLIARDLSQMLMVSEPEKLVITDEQLMKRIKRARERLFELRRMYGPVKGLP